MGRPPINDLNDGCLGKNILAERAGIISIPPRGCVQNYSNSSVALAPRKQGRSPHCPNFKNYPRAEIPTKKKRSRMMKKIMPPCFCCLVSSHIRLHIINLLDTKNKGNIDAVLLEMSPNKTRTKVVQTFPTDRQRTTGSLQIRWFYNCR